MILNPLNHEIFAQRRDRRKSEGRHMACRTAAKKKKKKIDKHAKNAMSTQESYVQEAKMV